MPDFKLKYPSSTSGVITCTVATLADDTTNGLFGRSSAAIDNTTTNDLDHLFTGNVRLGTSPVADSFVEVWAYAVHFMSAGTPVFASPVDGTDKDVTFNSQNTKLNSLIPIANLPIDAVSARTVYFPKMSIARLFGYLPEYWGIIVVNRSGVALDPTPGNHLFLYERIQAQSV